MNKELMIEKIKIYLSYKFNCSIDEFQKEGLNIVENNKEQKLKMLLFYDLILVSSPENMYHNVRKWLNDKNIYEIFEFPLVYGQTIYFVPNIKKINLQEEIDKYEFKLFDGNASEIELSSGFENAISFDNGICISDIAYCAYKDGKIIGVAGTDKIGAEQILIQNAGHINNESGFDTFEDIVSYL